MHGGRRPTELQSRRQDDGRSLIEPPGAPGRGAWVHAPAPTQIAGVDEQVTQGQLRGGAEHLHPLAVHRLGADRHRPTPEARLRGDRRGRQQGGPAPGLGPSEVGEVLQQARQEVALPRGQADSLPADHDPAVPRGQRDEGIEAEGRALPLVEGQVVACVADGAGRQEEGGRVGQGRHQRLQCGPGDVGGRAQPHGHQRPQEAPRRGRPLRLAFIGVAAPGRGVEAPGGEGQLQGDHAASPPLTWLRPAAAAGR